RPWRATSREGANPGGAVARPAAWGDELTASPLAGLPRRRVPGFAFVGGSRRLIGEAAIDQRLDTVALGQPKPHRRAEISDGARRLVQLAIGDAAQIQRLGSLGRSDIVGLDSGRE